jgi:hypothetical protein
LQIRLLPPQGGDREAVEGAAAALVWKSNSDNGLQIEVVCPSECQAINPFEKSGRVSGMSVYGVILENSAE